MACILHDGAYAAFLGWQSRPLYLDDIIELPIKVGVEAADFRANISVSSSASLMDAQSTQPGCCLLRLDAHKSGVLRIVDQTNAKRDG